MLLVRNSAEVDYSVCFQTLTPSGQMLSSVSKYCVPSSSGSVAVVPWSSECNLEQSTSQRWLNCVLVRRRVSLMLQALIIQLWKHCSAAWWLSYLKYDRHFIHLQVKALDYSLPLCEIIRSCPCPFILRRNALTDLWSAHNFTWRNCSGILQPSQGLEVWEFVAMNGANKWFPMYVSPISTLATPIKPEIAVWLVGWAISPASPHHLGMFLSASPCPTCFPFSWHQA